MTVCELSILEKYYMLELPDSVSIKFRGKNMSMNQKQISVISIDAVEKKVRLGQMESLGDKNPLSSFCKIAELEDGLCLYALPFMDMKSGKMNSSKCFVCTEDDIIETKGIGLIPFDNEDKAILYMDKLEKMIEWQY